MSFFIEGNETKKLFFFGEGNGNPLQCSCLENLRDGGAWWAAVCGVAQSRTRLKRLSSSSHSIRVCVCVCVCVMFVFKLVFWFFQIYTGVELLSTQNSLSCKSNFQGLPWLSSAQESIFQCRGQEFDLWWGNEDPTCCGATQPATLTRPVHSRAHMGN